MSDEWADLGAVRPRELAAARLQAHHAAQWLSKASRANLAAAPDDGHSNLGWVSGDGAFVSHDLPGAAGPVRVGLRLADLTLTVVSDRAGPSVHVLSEVAPDEVGAWLDARLKELALSPASPVELPYELPAWTGQDADGKQRATLAAWFGTAAEALGEIVRSLADARPGPSAVRCWPHHFDLASLVRFEEGDPEHARSIGVGLSPGDESYDQPYYYVTPWPYPNAPSLPALDSGHWRTEGFTAAILTGEEIVGARDPRRTTGKFLTSAIAAWRDLMGL